MQLVNNVSDAVLKLSLPDEESISIQTTGMRFALARHRPAKLPGFRLEIGDGKFFLPAQGGVLLSQMPSSDFVDTQVNNYVTFLITRIKFAEIHYFCEMNL